MEDDIENRVVKVTLERTNGEIDMKTIGDNDGVVCLIFSKEQDLHISAGYCEDMETQLELLSELARIVEAFAKAIELQRWVNEHRN